ncbi:hypothetical protein [Candidatus Borrarchaeum sp.]|uniref:hypothetical protein n=1 Tax=Candidatus Borrarchaeum sp. TaxID=2846742 RepID=UPI00257B3451|nr:hypothetical protein [Candidatus Borrarchaeum sp.]
MFSGIQSPYLGIIILIIVSLGVTLFLTKYSYLDKLAKDKKENWLPVLFLASFIIYGLFFSLVTLFRAEPEQIATISNDIFQVNIGFTLIILGCGLAIFFTTTEYQFKQDYTSKLLIGLSGVLAIIGFILIISTGLVYHKLL